MGRHYPPPPHTHPKRPRFMSDAVSVRTYNLARFVLVCNLGGIVAGSCWFVAVDVRCADSYDPMAVQRHHTIERCIVRRSVIGWASTAADILVFFNSTIIVTVRFVVMPHVRQSSSRLMKTMCRRWTRWTTTPRWRSATFQAPKKKTHEGHHSTTPWSVERLHCSDGPFKR